MLPDRDEVVIGVTLHEMDFVSVLRAARLLGTGRENIIRQAVADYLVRLQRQGLDVGIALPPEPDSEEKREEKVESASSGIQRAGNGSRHTD